MATPLYPDRDLINADWTKQVWDFPLHTLDDWRNEHLEEIRRIAKTPAFRAAPTAVRELFIDRLASGE